MNGSSRHFFLIQRRKTDQSASPRRLSPRKLPQGNVAIKQEVGDDNEEGFAEEWGEDEFEESGNFNS